MSVAVTGFRFDDFTFDPESGELTGPGGTTRLQPQPAALLALLLERAETIVSRREIQEHIWPDTTVEFDHGINFCIRRIRAALDERPDHPRFLETLPKRGYRFKQPVRRLAADPPPPLVVVPRRRHRLGVGIAAAVVVSAVGVTALGGGLLNRGSTSPPIIAVFPHSVTEDSDLRPEARRTAESVTARLVEDAERVRVIGPTGTETRPEGESTTAFARQTLNACYAVSGSMSGLDGGIVVFTQLIRVPDQTHLWANRDTLTTGIAATVATRVLDAVTALPWPDPEC